MMELERSIFGHHIQVLPVLQTALPSEDARKAAEVLFRQFAVGADGIRNDVLDKPTVFVGSPQEHLIDRLLRLFDIAGTAQGRALIMNGAGGTIIKIACPHCDADLTEWFLQTLYAARGRDSREHEVQLPCCGKKAKPGELREEQLTAHLASYVLEARNPTIRELTDDQMRQLKEVLGCELIQILLY